jgi:hypothetical protein
VIDRIKQLLRRHWCPQKIEAPIVDPALKDLDGAQRSAEVVRYSILSLEWWLSPNGTLREWLKLNGKIGSVLLIPAVLVVPLVTFILWQIAHWMTWLVSICGNLILFPFAALVAAAVIYGVVAIIRVVLGK